LQQIKPVILDRINLYANNEIKFNLLALVPEKRQKYLQEKILNENKREYILRRLNNNKEQENSNINSNDDNVNIKYYK
jgi:hypothetical protein